MKFAMRHWLLLLFMVVLAGCAAMESRSRMEQLDSLLRGYAKALTWSDFEVAYTATQAAQVAPLPDAALLKEIKITAYEPATPLVEQDGKTIRRVARIRYVHTSRMAERRLTKKERWKCSERG